LLDAGIEASLKWTKIDFGWGSASDPAGGAYSAPPDPLTGFKGTYFREGRGKEEIDGGLVVDSIK